MSESLRDGEAKARKDYVCDLCCLKILKGVKHYFHVAVDMGKVHTWRYHFICVSKTHDWHPDDWENISHDNGNGFRQTYNITQEIIDGGTWEPQTNNPKLLKAEV